MRHVSLSLLMAAGCLSAAATAAPPVSGGGRASATGGSSTTATTGGGGNTAGAAQGHGGIAASALLCSLFSGTDLMASGSRTTRAGAQRTDADHAIEFGSLWTAGHQTTVGSRAPADAAPVMATVKLPIVLSAAERKQFQDAGWTARYDAAGHRHVYCLAGSRTTDGSSAVAQQGALCIASGE